MMKPQEQERVQEGVPLSGSPFGEPRSQQQASRVAVDALVEAGLLDKVLEQADSGELRLTGEGGLLPELVKRVLEAGLAAELTDHLGYERHDSAGRGSGNSRNGSIPKRLGTEVGDVDLATPRDRNGTFDPQLVAKGQRRLDGLSDMIISLYAKGMTVRDIQHHLQATIGSELSHETISNITEAVAAEVKAWQARPLEAPGLSDRLPRRAVGEGPRRSRGAEQGRAHRRRGRHRRRQACAGDLGAIQRRRQVLGRGAGRAGQPWRPRRVDRVL